jgi:hypothetical protein
LLRGRLSALPELTRQVLARASVLGETFEVTDLVRLGGTSAEACCVERMLRVRLRRVHTGSSRDDN